MGGQQLPEAPKKWLCQNCNHVSMDDELLTAPNPFEEGDTLYACPNCREMGDLCKACAISGCENPATGGHPGACGYRYAWTCWQHSPHNEKAPGD